MHKKTIWLLERIWWNYSKKTFLLSFSPLSSCLHFVLLIRFIIMVPNKLLESQLSEHHHAYLCGFIFRHETEKSLSGNYLAWDWKKIAFNRKKSLIADDKNFTRPKNSFCSHKFNSQPFRNRSQKKLDWLDCLLTWLKNSSRQTPKNWSGNPPFSYFFLNFPIKVYALPKKRFSSDDNGDRVLIGANKLHPRASDLAFCTRQSWTITPACFIERFI